jgi:hypothetical protein
MLQLETISEEGLVADSLDLRRCGLDDESLDTIASAIEELFQKRDELMKEKKKKVQADFKPTQLLVSFNRLTSGRAIAKLCQVCSFSSIDATQNQITSDSIRVHRNLTILISVTADNVFFSLTSHWREF